jgi:hypothetical protein
MLQRTIPLILLLVLFASGAGASGTPLPEGAAEGNAIAGREALPAYSAALSVETLLMGSAALDAPLLAQAAAKAGVLTRFSLPRGLHALAGAGFQFELPSLTSDLGVSYRPFLSAWMGGGFGWTEARSGLGGELSVSLHSGGVPGGYAAEAMLDASVSFILRSARSSPRGAPSRAGTLPRYRAELAVPLGFALRSDSFSLYSGVGVRLWRDPFGETP